MPADDTDATEPPDGEAMPTPTPNRTPAPPAPCRSTPRHVKSAARLHKIFEDTGIKLDCVASDIPGSSGRAMRDALVQGTSGTNVPADLAKCKLRKKIPALREALTGRFDTSTR